jgi:hypothetical protein
MARLPAFPCLTTSGRVIVRETRQRDGERGDRRVPGRVMCHYRPLTQRCVPRYRSGEVPPNRTIASVCAIIQALTALVTEYIC